MVLQAERVLAARKVKALSFDGVNDYVSVPDSTSLRVAKIDIVALIKTTVNYGTLVDKWNFSGGQASYTFNLAPGHLRWVVHTTTGITILDDLNSNVWDRKWHFVRALCDGSEMQIWVDGVQTASKAKTGAILYYTNPLGIGARYDTVWKDFFKGLIHTVLIYGKILSEDELSQIIKNPYHPPLSGCVLWLSPESIDENAGVWRDQSGNGNNGTIYGAQAIEMNKLAFSVKSSSRVLEAV